MGGGKTTLTQGIASRLGYVEVVNSPTFTLLKEHHGGRIRSFTFDLYRLDTPDEMWDLGFEEYFGDAGLSVVEWAERAPDAWETLDLAVDRAPRHRPHGAADRSARQRATRSASAGAGGAPMILAMDTSTNWASLALIAESGEAQNTGVEYRAAAQRRDPGCDRGSVARGGRGEIRSHRCRR